MSSSHTRSTTPSSASGSSLPSSGPSDSATPAPTFKPAFEPSGGTTTSSAPTDSAPTTTSDPSTGDSSSDDSGSSPTGTSTRRGSTGTTTGDPSTADDGSSSSDDSSSTTSTTTSITTTTSTSSSSTTTSTTTTTTSTSSSSSSSSTTSSSSSSSTSSSSSSSSTSSSSSSTSDSSSDTHSHSSSLSSTQSTAPSTTPPPSTAMDTNSLSGSPSLTTFVTSYVTTINGQRTTLYTSVTTPILQTGIASKISSAEKDRIIVGGAVGGSAFILFLVLLGFLYWRWQKRSIANAHRRLDQPRNMQLRENDFDLAAPDTSEFMASGFPPPDHPMYQGPQPLMLLRPRGSGTGSIFREEGIWPPPAEGSRLQDPLLAASEVDLGQIVDNVMGSRDDVRATASASPTSYLQRDSPHTQRSSHLRESTSGSSVPLLSSPTHGRFPSTGSLPAGSPLARVFPELGGAEAAGISGAAARKAREAAGDAPPSSYAAYSGRPWPASTEGTVRSRQSLGSEGRPFSPDSVSGMMPPTSTLRLVNADPDDDMQSNAPRTGQLVDVSAHQDDPDVDRMQEIPPLYHTIRKDTDSTSSRYSMDSRLDQG